MVVDEEDREVDYHGDGHDSPASVKVRGELASNGGEVDGKVQNCLDREAFDSKVAAALAQQNVPPSATRTEVLEVDSVLLNTVHLQETPRPEAESSRSETATMEMQAMNPRTSTDPLMSTSERELPIPRIFRATWPSSLSRLMSYLRPLADVYVIVAMTVLYGTAPSDDDDSGLWRFAKHHKWLTIWIPFTLRFCLGFLHWALSLALMPGTVFFHDGPLQPLLNRIFNHHQRSFEARGAYRLDLLKVGGVELQLTTPDGVCLDVLYFRGRRAAPHSPTVIRFNGNAEAYELQDELLAATYTHVGLNLMVRKEAGRRRWSYRQTDWQGGREARQRQSQRHR